MSACRSYQHPLPGTIALHAPKLIPTTHICHFCTLSLPQVRLALVVTAQPYKITRAHLPFLAACCTQLTALVAEGGCTLQK